MTKYIPLTQFPIFLFVRCRYIIFEEHASIFGTDTNTSSVLHRYSHHRMEYLYIVCEFFPFLSRPVSQRNHQKEHRSGVSVCETVNLNL